jgi:stringent starvation protein B
MKSIILFLLASLSISFGSKSQKITVDLKINGKKVPFEVSRTKTNLLTVSKTGCESIELISDGVRFVEKDTDAYEVFPTTPASTAVISVIGIQNGTRTALGKLNCTIAK